MPRGVVCQDPDVARTDLMGPDGGLDCMVTTYVKDADSCKLLWHALEPSGTTLGPNGCLGVIPWKVRFDMEVCILAEKPSFGTFLGRFGPLAPPMEGRVDFYHTNFSRRSQPRHLEFLPLSQMSKS